MGGRGYKNDVDGYLIGTRRTVEFKAAYKTEDGKIDILYDIISPKAPTIPIFSNTANKIYALIGKRGTIKSIGFYDETHRLTKVIHLDHGDGGITGYHVHIGDSYHHESGNSRHPTEEEYGIIKRVLSLWKEKGEAYHA